MSQTNVAVTPGSGKNIDGFSTSGTTNVRQAIVIADPSTDASVAPVSATLGLSVNVTNSSFPVTGTFWQTTQPVSIATAPVLVAGSAIIGKVGIDQTTPGTTNAVSLSAETTKVIGTVNVASSQTIATTNAGTFAVQAAQSGTWTVQPGNTANTTAWKVDGSAVTQPVSGTFWQSTQPVSIATAPVLVAGTAIIGKVTTDQTTHGTTDLVAADITKIAGTSIVNGGVAGSISVGGTVATNVAITANPVNLGAQGVSSENSAITTARQVQLVADLVGKLIVLPYANPENFVSGVTAAMTGTTSTSLIAAPATGLRNYITHIIVTNSHATVGTFVIIQDGSGGTTLYEGYAAAAGGGFSITFPTPLRQPTTATAIFCADVTTGANVIVSASGYKGV